GLSYFFLLAFLPRIEPRTTSARRWVRQVSRDMDRGQHHQSALLWMQRWMYFRSNTALRHRLAEFYAHEAHDRAWPASMPNRCSHKARKHCDTSRLGFRGRRRKSRRTTHLAY